MDLMTPALPQEPADGVAGRAADLVDTLGGPGAGLAIALENLFPPLPSSRPCSGRPSARWPAPWPSRPRPRHRLQPPDPGRAAVSGVVTGAPGRRAAGSHQVTASSIDCCQYVTLRASSTYVPCAGSEGWALLPTVPLPERPWK
jgi:hypothetical protein